MSLNVIADFVYSVPCSNGNLAHAVAQFQSLARKGGKFIYTAFKTGLSAKPKDTDQWVIVASNFFSEINPAKAERIPHNLCRLLVEGLSIEKCGQLLSQANTAALKSAFTNTCTENYHHYYQNNFGKDVARELFSSVFEGISLSDFLNQVVKHQATLVNLLAAKKSDVVNESNPSFDGYPGSWLEKTSSFSPWMDSVFAEPVLVVKENHFRDKGKAFTVRYWEETKHNIDAYLPRRCQVHKILASGTMKAKLDLTSEHEIYAILLVPSFYYYQFTASATGISGRMEFQYDPKGLTRDLEGMASGRTVLLHGIKKLRKDATDKDSWHSEFSGAANTVTEFETRNMGTMQIYTKLRQQIIHHIEKNRELALNHKSPAIHAKLAYWKKILELCDGMF